MRAKSSVNLQSIEPDYIVVGAGTAGCALAARLSEDGQSTVLLLEAGGRDRSPWLHIPVGYYKTVGSPKFDWGYVTEPEAGLGDRRLRYPRARVVGGCGAINGLAYVRGDPADFDHWVELGNVGWGSTALAPYFERIERAPRHCEGYGHSGVIGIRPLGERRDVCEAFIKSAVSCGLEHKADINARDLDSVGYMHITVARGFRSSTAVAYLRPALSRPNLRLEVETLVERITFAGTRATGVEFRRGGERFAVKARREVLICSGAINTPQLLQLSGIGAPALLSSFDIPVVAASNSVGANLQDHFNVEFVYRLNRRLTLNDDLRSPSWYAAAAAKWLFMRKGPLVASAAHVIAFARSRQTIPRADLQFHFIPISLDETRTPHHFPGVSLDVCQLNPTSRGTVEIHSPDPAQAPAIRPRFLTAEADRRVILSGLKWCRRLVRASPFADLVAQEMAPGTDVESDDELLGFAEQTGGSIYHPVGTCAMGPDEGHVVDDRLRVRGVQNLRVVDCSVMPTIVSGNTNACAIVIAEKAADMIRADCMSSTREAPSEFLQ